MFCNMISAIKKLSVVLVVSVSFATGAGATPIEFIYTGTGSGTIGVSTFSNASFVITEQSDTSNIQSCGSCSFIDANSTSISIGGIGSYLFTTGTRTFDASGLVGFSRAGAGGVDLIDVFSVGSWNMISSIGPISQTVSLLQWGSPWPPVDTTGGVLSFNDSSTSGTFQAISGVPEPATYAMLLAGLGLIGFTTLRRKDFSA
jgi:PEP-CTERM motif